MNGNFGKRIKIPVRLVNGQWEFFYGGSLPVVDGAFGELSISRSRIQDKEFLERLEKPARYRILKENAHLLVGVKIKNKLSDELEKCLVLKEHLMPDKVYGDDYFNAVAIPDIFVQITIGKLTEVQKKLFPKNKAGGVWLELSGMEPKRLVSSSIIVPEPVSEEPVSSLNHAYTRMSEVYEPWRISHTGNIYNRIFYQERNGNWYPLSIMRDAYRAKEEHRLISEQWAQICKRLNINRPNA